ncbi:WD40 repeat domain-containing protein [Altericista sp. CCNU0014]|uniref:WD40 repeat domain-containing protein n=1 Tax=Altericista sp. CCNU0014 TaxID=3082949 RepID=UPI00385149AF
MLGLKSSSRQIWQKNWSGSLSDYVTAIGWSPQGDMLAACSAAGEVLVLRELSDRSLLDLPSQDSLNSLAFSADGRYLAAGGQGKTLFVWQFPGSEELPASLVFSLPSKHWVEHVAWHPQLNWLAFNVGRYVQVWDTTSQRVITTLPFEASSALCFDWSPDGKFLAVGGYQGAKVWNCLDWDDDPYLVELPSASVALSWSPDSRYLASGNMDRTITVIEWQDGQPSAQPWVMRGFPGKIRYLAWSSLLPNASKPILASTSVEGIVIWERSLNPLVGWDGRVLENHTQAVEAIAFQPQAIHLASAGADGLVNIWQKAKHLTQTLTGANQGFSCLGWHPKGQSLAAGGKQGELLIWSQTQAGKGFSKV